MSTTPQTAGSGETGRSCPYCRFPIKEGQGVERCGQCDSVHHADCWSEGGGCAIVGCASRADEQQTAMATAVKGKAVANAPLPPPPPGYVYAPAPTAQDGSGSKALLYGLMAGIVIAVVGIGGYIIANPDTPEPPIPPPVPTTTTTRPSGPSQEQLAGQLSEIAQFSEQGRSAVSSGNFQAAIANRNQVLSRLDGLEGTRGNLSNARKSLRAAMNYSLQSDQCYASGGDCSYSDSQATAYKKNFVRFWNPIAEKYGYPTYTESTI